MKIFFFTLLILGSNYTFGNEIDSLKQRLIESISKLNNLDERLNKSEKLTSDLQKQLDQKESQFELYQILLEKHENSRSSLIAEFSVLIGVLTVIFGLVGYFTAYRPAQESKKEIDRLLEKLQTNIDDIFSIYLRKNRDKLINNYLEILLNKDESETSNAIHYLNSVKHEGFNSEQLFKMRKLVLEDEFDVTHQMFTNMIFTKDEIVENTCTEIISKNIKSVKSYALIYLAQHGIHNYDKLVIKNMNKTPDDWGTIMASIRSSSEDYLITLWDNNFDELNSESMAKISSTLNFYKEHQMNKDKSVELFLNKVKASKFGQAKKESDLRGLFTYTKSLF